MIDVVSDENIVNDFKKLCIRQSNLNYIDDEIVYANLKKSAIFYTCFRAWFLDQINDKEVQEMFNYCLVVNS